MVASGLVLRRFIIPFPRTQCYQLPERHEGMIVSEEVTSLFLIDMCRDIFHFLSFPGIGCIVHASLQLATQPVLSHICFSAFSTVLVVFRSLGLIQTQTVMASLPAAQGSLLYPESLWRHRDTEPLGCVGSRWKVSQDRD